MHVSVHIDWGMNWELKRLSVQVSKLEKRNKDSCSSYKHKVKPYLHPRNLCDIVRKVMTWCKEKLGFKEALKPKINEPLEENIWLENSYDTMVIISNTLTTFVILHSKKRMTERYVGCTCRHTCLELKT